MKKRTNPRRIPGVENLQKEKANAIRCGIVIVFSALLDKHGMEAADLQALWEDIGKLSGEIAEGRVSIRDLDRVLREEYEIEVLK